MRLRCGALSIPALVLSDNIAWQCYHNDFRISSIKHRPVVRACVIRAYLLLLRLFQEVLHFNELGILGETAKLL